jgi:hypothetical protein
LLIVVATSRVARPADEKKPHAKDFYGVWIEERREPGGKVYDQPNELFGWDLGPDDGGCWERRGESVYTSLGKIRIRTDKKPVWLDFIGGKEGDKVWVRPGIVKLQGKKMVWVWAKEWYLADLKDVADWSKRPRSFEVTKDGPWEKKVLYKSSGRYTTD